MTIDETVDKIATSKKYKFLCKETIKNVLEEYVLIHKDLKRALPYAKKSLHKIWASYLGEPNYKRVKERLTDAFSVNDDALIMEICEDTMSVHSSARERMQLYEQGYYKHIFAKTGQPSSIADLACALHPLSFRWMNLPSSVPYFAYDINRNFTDLLGHYFELEGIGPMPIWQDIYVNPPTDHVDVALLFKMYHCLEIRKKGAGLTVLKQTPADWVVISFPAQNLMGKKADIYGNYAPAIHQAVEEFGWEMTEELFVNEMLVIIKKLEN